MVRVKPGPGNLVAMEGLNAGEIAGGNIMDP